MLNNKEKAANKPIQTGRLPYNFQSLEVLVAKVTQDLGHKIIQDAVIKRSRNQRSMQHGE